MMDKKVKMIFQERIYKSQFFFISESAIMSSQMMEVMKYSLVKEIEVSRDDQVLKLRIIRMWRQPMFRNPAKTYSIEVVFVDEEDNRVQGSVLHKWLIRFERFLVDKACLIIRKPSFGYVHQNKYRVIDIPFKVCLNYNNTVTKCDEFAGPLHGFVFTAFNAVINCEVSETSSIDLIGVVTKIWNIQNYNNENGNDKLKMSIQLTDLESRNVIVTLWDSYATEMSYYLTKHPDHQITSRNVIVTLWDSYATEMSYYLTKHPDEANVVVILQFAKFKNWNGRYSVSNSYYVSRLYINVEIDEVRSFKSSWLRMTGNHDSSSVPRLTSTEYYSIEKDFLATTELKCIGELDGIKKEHSFIVVGSIISIVPHEEWYYDACFHCNKKVHRIFKIDVTEDASMNQLQQNLYGCKNPTCNKKVITHVPRFRIVIKVQDATGSTSLTLFDHEANKILKKTTNEVLESYLQADVMDAYPVELEGLLKRKLAFKIEITNFNIRNNSNTYGIAKICQDASIIEQLEKKLTLLMPLSSESVVLHSQDYHSQGTLSLKDVPSDKFSVETPINDGYTSTGRSVKEIHPKKSITEPSLSGVKRNMIDVLDVEEEPLNASTKPRSKSSSSSFFEHLQKLLTPKIEK